MNTLIQSEFIVPFSDLWQQLGYTSELKAAADLKMSDLVRDVDYVEPDHDETFFTKEGAFKFLMIAETEQAKSLREQMKGGHLALPEATETIEGELVQPLPPIDPNIKFFVDRSNGVVWGKVDEHYFTVSFTGTSTFYYNTIDWSFPDSIVEDGQIKTEIVDYALGLI